MIAESVAFLVGAGKRVIYDAEHFFDGFATTASTRSRCLRAAAEAGRRDGRLLRHERRHAPASDRGGDGRGGRGAGGRPACEVGIHCHDDAGCGVANTIAAVEAGRAHVQGTMNGYGERCGNANLVTIIPNLQLKLGYECLTDAQLASLTQAAHFFDELLNFTPDPDQPYVGRNAFAHKGGMHVAGVNADPATFEHIDPDVVGNRRELLISELSGKGTRVRDAPATPDLARRRLTRDGWSSGSRSSSTAATTTKPPTARSSCCCAARRATTSRCSCSSPGA